MSLFKGFNSSLADNQDWFPCEPGLAGDNYLGTVRIREYPEFLEELTDCYLRASCLVPVEPLCPSSCEASSTMSE